MCFICRLSCFARATGSQDIFRRAGILDSEIRVSAESGLFAAEHASWPRLQGTLVFTVYFYPEDSSELFVLYSIVYL